LAGRVHKNNGKPKCKGQRIVHLLDPIGKSHTDGLWQKRRGFSTHNASGFRKHRRREQTIMQVKICRWTMDDLKLNWIAAFYDQANAFASTSHQIIDKTVYDCLEWEDAVLIVGRHRFGMTFLQADDGGWILFGLGCGDLQGDKAAPDKFLQVFDPRVQRWVEATITEDEREFFTIKEPYTGTEVDVSYGTYADDLVRLGLNPQGDTVVQEAARKLREWDEALEMHVTQDTHLRQNTDKKRNYVQSVWGRGSDPYAYVLSRCSRNTRGGQAAGEALGSVSARGGVGKI